LLHDRILLVKDPLEFALLQVTDQYLLLLGFTHLTKLPQLVLLEDAKCFHILSPLSFGLLLQLLWMWLMWGMVSRSTMRTLATSSIVCLTLHNVKEFTIGLLTKATLLIVIQAVLVSGGFSMVINVYAHLGHLLLLDVNELALLFPL
jgi:hypothetical protein